MPIFNVRHEWTIYGYTLVEAETADDAYEFIKAMQEDPEGEAALYEDVDTGDAFWNEIKNVDECDPEVLRLFTYEKIYQATERSEGDED